MLKKMILQLVLFLAPKWAILSGLMVLFVIQCFIIVQVSEEQ